MDSCICFLSGSDYLVEDYGKVEESRDSEEFLCYSRQR